ncbi:MAG: NmrA/HSCARG family protein [Methanomassiliicoccus sp.]|nr:NmrA/HSCARG family protein [Methanomassiliicoccus sp.]
MVEIKDRTIFVTGATGHQGSAAARHLLEAGYRVRGLTRDPDSSSGQMLKELGAELVQGDLDDPTSVRRALAGSYGVFAVLTWVEEGPAGEVKQGRILADAAKAEGVEHFLYSSVCGADRNTGIPHFESKATNERYMRSIDLPLTVLRPVYFMENFNSPTARRLISEGNLVMSLSPQKPLQMVSVEDIGFLAAIILDNPEDWAGRTVDIAGDSLTMPEVAERFSEVTGRKVFFREQPLQDLKKIDKERYLMLKWLNEHGYDADIEAIRRLHPTLLSFDQWLKGGFWKGEEAMATTLRTA